MKKIEILAGILVVIIIALFVFGIVTVNKLNNQVAELEELNQIYKDRLDHKEKAINKGETFLYHEDLYFIFSYEDFQDLKKN